MAWQYGCVAYSVLYEVVRTETREVERPLSWFDNLARAVFWIVTGAVVIGVALWMAKRMV